MNKSFLAFTAVAALATAAAFATPAVFAGEVDPAGQFAEQVHSTLTRAEVQDQLAQFKQAGGVPHWAMRYNQLTGFHSDKTRAQVQAEFLGDREEATAMTAEDSGSAYLSKLATVHNANQYLAGTPVNAQ